MNKATPFEKWLIEMGKKPKEERERIFKIVQKAVVPDEKRVRLTDEQRKGY